MMTLGGMAPISGVDWSWSLLVELRKELVDLQKLRAQVLGFKITFVSAAIGLIGANLDKARVELLVIPAFAAVFFDMLITSYSYSIKQTGLYVRCYLEPVLRIRHDIPSEYPLWEEFVAKEGRWKNISILGNLGITFVAGLIAAL